MARIDRREKLALDESYRYYRMLDKNGERPQLYQLVKCFKTVAAALQMTDGHFKLTTQLWRRIHQALFDKLITSFPGYAMVTDGEGRAVPARKPFPEEGVVEFHPEGCRRADDIFRMEIRHLYPATQYKLAKVWSTRGANVMPEDFSGAECGPEGCFLKPVVLGDEVLAEESQSGKETAYREWWDLYWQAYCTGDKQERHMIYRQMDSIEQVWGNQFY